MHISRAPRYTFDSLRRLVGAIPAGLQAAVNVSAVFEMPIPDIDIPIQIYEPLFLPFDAGTLLFIDRSHLPVGGHLSCLFSGDGDDALHIVTFDFIPDAARALGYQAAALAITEIHAARAGVLGISPTQLPPLSTWKRSYVYALPRTGLKYKSAAEPNISIELRDIVVGHIETFIGALAIICSPRNVIVEERPSRIMRKRPATELIRPRNARPIYSVLAPNELRTIFPEAATAEKGTHASPVSHRRRRHLRTLRSPRYGDRVGERILVRECWVGPREVEHRGRRYRVRLDL